MDNNYSQFSIRTLCYSCAGCSKEEIKNFPGVVKCDSYIFAYPEYGKSLDMSYGSEVENKKK